MTQDEKEKRLKEAYAKESLCKGFAIIVESLRERLEELNVMNGVPDQANKISGAMVLREILAQVDAHKDTESAA